MQFTYNRDIFFEAKRCDVPVVVFRLKKILPDVIYDAVKLVGNPFTFPEVKTVLDGVTVGGYKLCHQDQIVRQRDSYASLLNDAATGAFSTKLDTWIHYNALLTLNGVSCVSRLRESNVGNNTTARVQPDWQCLPMLFANENAAIERITNPVERAYAYFASAAFNRFFDHGNRHTGQLIMNGVLLTQGIDGVSIPASKQVNLNAALVDLHESHDATPLFELLIERHKHMGLLPSDRE